MFRAVVKEAVQAGIYSNKELAIGAGCSQSGMSLILSGQRPMTRETEAAIILATENPRFSEERCFYCPGNLFPTRYLDAIDDHPVISLDKLIEEAAEFIRAANLARKVMINKKPGHAFMDQDNNLITDFENQTADLITGAKTVLIKMQEWYKRPVLKVMKRHLDKLEKNGHVTKRKSPVTRTGHREILTKPVY